jgi:hypothetical protein
MTTRSPVSPEVRALLEQERVILPVSASQRARATARARAALAAPVVPTSARSGVAPRTRWAAAAAAVLVVSAAVAAAAYEIRTRFAPEPVTGPAAAPSAPAVVAIAPASSSAEVAVPAPPPAPSATVAAPPWSSADAARAELRLLGQARAAVARGDFAAALSPIAEHARRFKNGRLVEEREALRVKALVGLGRGEEARHAAADFRARFPRSVLLPAVSQMPSSRP